MGELASVLDALGPALAADDLFVASNADLLERTDALITAKNQIEAELARTVRRAELAQAPEHDGLKTMGSWLRNHQRLSGPAVNTLIRAGRGLAHLPAVDTACTAGHITLEQAAELAKAVTPDNLAAAAAQGIDLAEIERTLLAVAQPFPALCKVVKRYTDDLDPDGPEPDPTEDRSLTVTQHPDGTWTIRGTLDAIAGEKFATSIEAISAASRTAEDTRTSAQRRGDALAQLSDLALASGQLPVLRTVKPHVGVLIGLDDLIDPDADVSHDAGTTGLQAAISAARARWLACDGNISRIVIGPDSTPLDLGRTHRVVPPHLRRAVEARDQTCVFAGCDAPAWWCDVHHVLHWLDGGETSLENSALLCERHHGKVHHGFRIERDPDGRWRTYRPDGTEILIGAPLLL